MCTEATPLLYFLLEGSSKAVLFFFMRSLLYNIIYGMFFFTECDRKWMLNQENGLRKQEFW